MNVRYLSMTEVALYLAASAKKEGNIISFEDDIGTVKADSNTGEFVRVYPDGRVRPYKSGQFSTREKCYGVVSVRVDGQAKVIYQHILMNCLAHFEDYEPGLITGHKDSVKWHNSADNLEWVAPSQNKKMESLVYNLELKYPGKYTMLRKSLNDNIFLASKVKINHSDIDKISAVIDKPAELDALFGSII